MKHSIEELFKTNPWFLLSTKLRLEKTACNNLFKQGYKTFLPTLAFNNKPASLFSGYIFVQPRLGA